MSDLTDELTKLAALRERGILTDAEFDAQKAQLLSGGRQSSSASAPPTGAPAAKPHGAGFLATTQGKIIAAAGAGIAALVAVTAMSGHSDPPASYSSPSPSVPVAGAPAGEQPAQADSGGVG